MDQETNTNKNPVPALVDLRRIMHIKLTGKEFVPTEYAKLISEFKKEKRV